MVRGASDARRRGTAAASALLGGGLSCCSAGCPFAAPSALRVVGAESSISLAITGGASAFANLEVAFHTSSL